ncbi:MAG: ArdC family protein [Chloroflexota bacterium]|nr:ArdC family protein [Chloroflexota bacterium]
MEQASSEDRLAATLRTLDEGIASILDSDAFARYLDVMSRFHHYSFGNVMLILAQQPDATQVAGYRRWQQLGRQVKKGEQGIRILVPHKRVVELEKGEETTIVRSFGVGSVFDISQTDGDPLPEPPAVQEIREATDTGAALYRALETYVSAQGLTVVREELARGYGYYAPLRKQIGIDSRLVGDQATKTLAHETAHFVADHRCGMPREDAETVAESAAYVVLQHYGLDSSGYTFAYVARWAEDRAVLTRNLSAIQQTSHAIIAGIEDQNGHERREVSQHQPA